MKDHSIFQGIKELTNGNKTLKFEGTTKDFSYQLYELIDNTWIYRGEIINKKNESNKDLFERGFSGLGYS